MLNTELTEEQAEFLLDFYYSIELTLRSSTAMGIFMAIARETVLRGSCRISHKDFGRRSGRCRRSIDKAIKTLKRHRLIERVGTTEDGVAIYRAIFDAMSGGNAVA